MTFVIAWKESDTVYCVSDSAITGLGETETSSFGELSYTFPDGKVVEEKGMKIVPIADNFIVAFSGNVHFANKYIEHLRENNSHVNIEQSLHSIVSSNPVPDKYSFQLLLLCYTQHNEAKLFSWKSVKPDEILDVPVGISIGSIESQLRKIAHKQLEYLVTKARMTPDSAFHCMIAILQQLGIINLLMEQGIGGAFFGAKVGPNGFSWQKDITYVLYPPSLVENAQHNEKVRNTGVGELRETQLDVITCMVRDNAWITHSPFNKGVKIITRADLTHLTPKQFVEKWDEPLRQNAEIFESDYYAFASKIGDSVTIVKTGNDATDNKYFSIIRLGRREFEFFLKAELLNILAVIPDTNNPNERSTYFRFLVA